MSDGPLIEGHWQTCIEGRCHCGRTGFELFTRQADEAIQPRACQCGFCRQHAARCWSDPEGRAHLLVTDPTALQHYRFGLNTADFLLCRHCGGYLGAMIPEAVSDGQTEPARITLNLRLTELRERPAQAADYEGETAEQRMARRRRGWTPLVAG